MRGRNNKNNNKKATDGREADGVRLGVIIIFNKRI